MLERKEVRSMSEKNICPVHGDKSANECHNYSTKKAELLGHPEWAVDAENCNCDVGTTGPALTGGNVPTGPAADKPTGPATEI